MPNKKKNGKLANIKYECNPALNIAKIKKHLSIITDILDVIMKKTDDPPDLFEKERAIIWWEKTRGTDENQQTKIVDEIISNIVKQEAFLKQEGQNPTISNVTQTKLQKMKLIQ